MRARRLIAGIRPVDVVLALGLVVLAAVLAVANVESTDGTEVDSRSWMQLPVFVAAMAPVLWWRRSLVLASALSCALLLAHLLAFGALVRCGAGLPLAFALAFLGPLAYAGALRRAVSLGLSLVAATLVLLRDTAAGPSLIPTVAVLCVVLFGIGHVVAHRARLAQALRRRNAELRLLRDERAALEVQEDRTHLSGELEAMLEARMRRLATAAETGADAGPGDPAATRALLLALEEDSRATLGQMREVVGRLRGGEVALAPAPSVAHLDALLARHRTGTRLQVDGQPRVLPASVELSAYRIVEHLVLALADDQPVPLAVAMAFTDDALDLHVSGPVSSGADLRAAATRARERVRLHAGSLDVKVTRGRVRAMAHLPVAQDV